MISCAATKTTNGGGPTTPGTSETSNSRSSIDSMGNRSKQARKKKALMVCSESPYPFVVGGYERLIKDYQAHVFSDYDVYFLACRRDSLEQLFHYGVPVRNPAERERILAENFAFAYFIHSDFDCDGRLLVNPLIKRIPSFYFTQLHPNPESKENDFRGIVTHYSERPHGNVLQIGGAYNPNVFFKNRQSEEFVV